jgi:hypothetical protein
LLTAEPASPRKIPRLAILPLTTSSRQAGARCRQIIHCHGILVLIAATADSVSVSRLTTTSPGRWWFVVTSHKSAPALSIAFPQIYPRPSCLLPRLSLFPTSPVQGSLHDTTRHNTPASTQEALRRLPASHRPGSRRFASKQPTSSLLARPSIPPAV